jgi:predicted methyltransferase MtxX (methanogen marker protein 4)
MSTETPRGTRAHTPDLDWSQVRETVLMLELAAGQVDAAMRDSNSSVQTLTDTFTSMADTLNTIDVALGTLPDTIGNGMVKAEIQENARQVAQKVHQAIIAFQFYDKLVQRLDHVCHSLSGLSGLVSDTGRLYNPQQWSALQELIRSKYTMAEERDMFDAVMAGATVEEALKHYMTARMQQVEDSGGEIELF